jgi:putative transposase
MRRSKYSTDLSDSEWTCLKLHLPASKKRARGRPRIHNLRDILDAIFFYVLTSGCPWRLLPRCFPPWIRASTIGSGSGASRRDLRAAKRGAARRALARTAGKEPTAQCGDSRFSISQDERSSWWPSTGLRRRQEEDSRAQATTPRRYGRVGAQSQRPQCQGVPDQDGIKLLLKATRERLPRLSHLWVDAGFTRVGAKRVGRAGARAECRSRTSHAEANIGEGRKDLGEGMGEGG